MCYFHHLFGGHIAQANLSIILVTILETRKLLTTPEKEGIINVCHREGCIKKGQSHERCSTILVVCFKRKTSSEVKLIAPEHC